MAELSKEEQVVAKLAEHGVKAREARRVLEGLRQLGLHPVELMEAVGTLILAPRAALSPVSLRFTAGMEHVEGEFSHAMLVVQDPEDPSGESHRLYFSGEPVEQAQMLAVCLDYMGRSGLVDGALKIMEWNPGPGEIRGIRGAIERSDA